MGRGGFQTRPVVMELLAVTVIRSKFGVSSAASP